MAKHMALFLSTTRRRALSVTKSRRGQAAIEVTLMAPWIFLLFIAIFNFGFYAYTLISVENAARVAALYTSSISSAASDASGACYHAAQELSMMTNLTVTGSTVCTCAGGTCTLGTGTPAPLAVSVQAIPGASCPDAGYVVGGSQCSQVTVTYRGIQLFPLPYLMGKLDVTRTAIAKVRTD
jgi:Flp pilus assembly protein TadG